MPVQNSDVAAQLNRMADLLDIEDANPFRVRAYRNAARTVKGLARPRVVLARLSYFFLRVDLSSYGGGRKRAPIKKQ